MSKHIQLHIPEPCHENWGRMTSAEKGRFCSSCQKQVVDFTGMNDEQLVAFFKRRSTGSVCGRFMQDQLDRSIDIPKKRIPWVKYFFQFALPAFLVSCKWATIGKLKETSIVQTKITDVKTETLEINSNRKIVIANQTTVGVIFPEIVMDSIITGDIECFSPPEQAAATSDTSQAVDGQVTVSIIADKPSKNEIKTANISNDTIVLPEIFVTTNLNRVKKDLSTGSVVTKISKNTNKVILDQQLFSGKVGGVCISEDYLSIEPKDSLIKKIFIKSNRFSFKIFPNPVNSGSSINIEWKGSTCGHYLVELINLSGQSVFTKEIYVDENARLLNFLLPRVAVGTYLLRIKNNQLRQSSTEKIIIE